MDTKSYLKSFGWKEGEALQQGGLKRPLLVEHKKDNKGLGHGKDKDGETWWESLFDGHLKNLEVSRDSASVNFSIDENKVAATIRKKNSPLYRMFIQGEGLEGTVGKTDFEEVESKLNAEEVFEKQVHSKLVATFEEVEEEEKKQKREKNKIEKKEKKKIEKKEKKHKTEKKEKKGKKGKKVKKDKTEKTEKTEKKVKKDNEKRRKSDKDKKVNPKKDQTSEHTKSSKRRLPEETKPSKKSKTTPNRK
ncbi:hypothetical protein PSN45_001383 [Yamadazyma tenuis]|uniref:uncharacterized protein n=1 Tax=Candida tenuis TaxID=2315449 RepID=UPI00279FA569|nr:hypothetical protein PSN45_001383 [Yamadazyma tenuis]